MRYRARGRKVFRTMILFENVTKKYRGTSAPALDNLSLTISRGEFVFIVGASGSGKSSCLRLILREDRPSRGNIHVLGQNLGRISTRKVPFFRRSLGTVFQDFRLLTGKTVYDNVAFSLQVIGKSRGFIQEAVPDTLQMVGLQEKAKRFPNELSGGEQQRVAIARAIVNKPAILLADEPTGNLDPATSLGIMQLLRAINAAGTTVVMATHEATFVDIMQQRVIELAGGVIVRDEVGGGYGETASIPLAKLTEHHQGVLRTTEAVMREALNPQNAPAETAATIPGDAAGRDSTASTASSVSGVSPSGGADVTAVEHPLPRQGRNGTDPADAARLKTTQQPAGEPGGTPASASVYSEPDPLGTGDITEIASQARAGGNPLAGRLPTFLEPDEPLDPEQLAAEGGVAARLGLQDDTEDVGPSR